MHTALAHVAPRLMSHAEAAELLIKWGRNELEEKSKPKWKLFVEQVRGRSGCGMWDTRQWLHGTPRLTSQAQRLAKRAPCRLAAHAAPLPLHRARFASRSSTSLCRA